MIRGKLILALFLAGFALTAVVAWRFASRQSPASLPASPTKAPSATSGVASASSTPRGSAEVSTNTANPKPDLATPQDSAVTRSQEGPVTTTTVSDIQFIPWEKIKVASVTGHADDYAETTSYDFRRVGRFVTGPYKDAELLLAFVSDDGPCKGDGCGDPVIVRYIRRGDELFPLPKLSAANASDESVGRGKPVDLRPLEQIGVKSAKPLDLSVPSLDYPEKLTAGPRAVLKIVGESVGLLNRSRVEVAFHDAVYGDIWMAKPSPPGTPPGGPACDKGDSGAATPCQKFPEFGREMFYLQRPDGTLLSYSFTPDFPPGAADISWHEGAVGGSNYDFGTTAGCQASMLELSTVLAPSELQESDLKPIGKINSTGDVVYGLKNKKHALYKSFYDAYLKEFPNWVVQSAKDPETLKPATYEEFLEQRPLFFWKDPFGRWTRFVNEDFALPNLCEPILYLYPEKEEKVEVKLGEEIAVTASYPAYRGGWSVIAQPDGELFDAHSGRRMPYLFWEGHSYVLPSETKGFVVKGAEVREFLEKTLPQLGLNEKETRDFVTVWAPKLNSSPYYFLTFLERSVADRYYPLNIQPQPDTTIRVLMDYRPLNAPMYVAPLELAQALERRGFTAVEWGVVVR